MSISIDWGTKIITVPKAYTTLVQSTPTEIREMPLNQFRLDLKALEASAEGMPHLATHRHNTEVLLGGIVYARTIEIINGYTVTFEDGFYAVNLVGANANVGDVVNVNSVSVRSSNAAGLISNTAIEFSSFDDHVTIDTASGNVGTVFPTGTAQRPVDNLADAILIAEFRGLKKLQFQSDFNFLADTNIAEYEIFGEGLQTTALSCLSGAHLTNCEFYDASIYGSARGVTAIEGCLIHHFIFEEHDASDDSIFIKECLVNGTITVPSAYSGDIKVIDSTSNVAGTGTPTFDFGNSTSNAIVRNWAGGLKVQNVSQGNDISIDLVSGSITVDSTVTNGLVNCRGIGTIADNSTLSAVVLTDGLVTNTAIEYASFSNQVAINVLSGYSGTSFPHGTPQRPVNNLADALTIAESRGINSLKINGDITLSADTVIDDYEIFGEGLQHSTITVLTGAQMSNCEFYDAELYGNVSGIIGVTRCLIHHFEFGDYLTNAETILINESLVRGAITVPSTYTGDIKIIDCYSDVAGTGSPTVDINDSASDVIMRNWSGGIKIKNVSQPNSISIDIISGSVNVDSTVINGVLNLRGIGTVADSSSLSAVVKTDGLLTNSTIEFGSFNGQITIDANSSNTGTTFPVGTELAPVNNLTDAKAIATTRGFGKLHILSDFTFLSSDVLVSYDITGNGQQTSTFTFQNGAIAAFCRFFDCEMTGSITGLVGASNCFLNDLGSLAPGPTTQDVIITECLIGGTLGIPALYSGSLKAINCYSNVAGHSTPVLDLGGSDANVIMRNWSGGIQVSNATTSTITANEMSIDLIAGNVNLDSSNTNLHVAVRGVGTITDNTTLSSEVTTDGLINKENIALANASDDGFAQGSGNGVNQIQLRAAASSSNAAYDPSMILIREGTGAGQGRLVYNYDGASRTATVDRNWNVQPDTTSKYAILPNPGREHVNEGLVLSATLSSVALNSAASNTDEMYTGQSIFLRSGTGDDQVRSVLSYDGTTHDAVVADWVVTPDATTAYVMLPNSSGGSGGGGEADWTLSEKSQIRSALGVGGTKVTAAGGQLQENTVATKVAATNAEEVNLKVQ